ncbi:MAG TPA: benzoyl-CoA reductase subunit D [Thermoanaerobaculia bacterium]|nr:benzoyl-CoA reductase subunit D [Thermoanaerobaculia bacterium]
MTIACGIDVGSSAVKVAVVSETDGAISLLARSLARVRRRTLPQVVEEAFGQAVRAAEVDAIDYVATTGEGEEIPFATGHFYGMTAHARGALYLEPECRVVLDVGALHSRAFAIDGRGKVLRYKMTSQCASGSGQFLESIARYLGVAQSEIGALSLASTRPETVSSICAVLAETDVINMVSRGIAAADILRGLHDSMAGRLARLLQSVSAGGTVFVSGGLSADEGLIGALGRALARTADAGARPVEIRRHPLSVYAGAIGAGIWGAFRFVRLGTRGVAWKQATA